MLALLKVIVWSLAGSAVGGILLFFGLFAYDRVFEPSEDAAVQGFQTGAEILGGLGGAIGGLVIGAIVGIVDACVNRTHSKESQLDRPNQ